jgi:hypothetical protein
VALSLLLRDIVLRHPCQCCGHMHEKTGEWFLRSRQFTCAACRTTARITYDDKIKLFDDHAHLRAGYPALEA